MKMPAAIPVILLVVYFPLAARAAVISFDNAPMYSPLPISYTEDGVTMHLSGTASGYSIQSPSSSPITPIGFTGCFVYPSSINAADLLISFDEPMSDFSIQFAPEEYGSDSSATLQVRAYMGTSLIGSNTGRAPIPGTWPVGTLSYSSAQPFDNVVIHYLTPPVAGENWGPIFIADNMTVTPAPEPGSIATIGLFLGAMLLDRKRRN